MIPATPLITIKDAFFRAVATPLADAATCEPASPRKHARPPRAVDEALFERLCDGCNLCVESCPQQILSLEQGLAIANVDFEHCSLCESCVKACPTGALHNSLPLQIDLNPHFGDACNNYVGLHCRDCVVQCPSQAITIADYEKPKLNASLCTGCGMCKPKCYVSSIEMRLISVD